MYVLHCYRTFVHWFLLETKYVRKLNMGEERKTRVPSKVPALVTDGVEQRDVVVMTGGRGRERQK